MSTKLRNAFFILLLIAYGLQLTAELYADTIYTKDGREVVGIIVEDYKDRIILSTADGEITLMKSGIKELYYDNEEDNLIKLAEQAKARRDYVTSYAYYDKAYKLNPDSKAAKDGIIFLQGYLFRKEEAMKAEDVQRYQEIERYGRTGSIEKSEEDVVRELLQKMKGIVGMTLNVRGGFPEADSVRPDSPAYDAGIRRGDLLIAIWGRLTGYMTLKEVMTALLDKPSAEIKATIERTVDVTGNPIDASFSMEFDGLTISNVKWGGAAYLAELKKGDLVVAINGQSTRYMPLKKAIESIRNSEGNVAKLTIRRDIIIWRSE